MSNACITYDKKYNYNHNLKFHLGEPSFSFTLATSLRLQLQIKAKNNKIDANKGEPQPNNLITSETNKCATNNN